MTPNEMSPAVAQYALNVPLRTTSVNQILHEMHERDSTLENRCICCGNLQKFSCVLRIICELLGNFEIDAFPLAV
jgi:hypothetical protein